NNSFSQRQVATLYDELNQYRVVMELDPRFTSDPAVLEQVEVVTAEGSRVPLSTFASWGYGMVSDRVRHDAQFASVGVGYALAPGVPPYDAEQAIERMLAEIMLPASVHTVPASAGRPDFSVTLTQPWLLLRVVLAVYLVLGVLYESTLHPLTILVTLPSAGVGALLALQLRGTSSRPTARDAL